MISESPTKTELQELLPYLTAQERGEMDSYLQAENSQVPLQWKPNLLILHPAQAQIKREAKRFNVLDCGRRFGKDVLGHELSIEPAMSGYPVAWFTPTYRMMLDTFRDIERIVRPVSTRVNASDHRIELTTGGILDFWSLDSPITAKGHKYKRVIINEAAIAPKLSEAFNEVIRPMLADYIGDAWFLSTPKGVNFFRTLYIRGKDQVKDYASWKFPTSANPYISPDEIEAMRQEMTERSFQQEILAEFLEGEGAVFRNVRTVCVIRQPDLPEDHTGHMLVCGLDWGKMNDFTRIRVGCINCRRVVDWDGFNQIDYAFQRDRLRIIFDRWSPQLIAAESNSIGVPNIEMLRRDGFTIISFETTAVTKPPLIESLSLTIERGEWSLPEEDADELEMYEMRVNPNTGRPTYTASEGNHDDRVMADALMIWYAKRSGGSLINAQLNTKPSRWANVANTANASSALQWTGTRGESRWRSRR